MIVPVAAALSALAVNLFWLSPSFVRLWGDLPGNVVYAMIRIGIVVAFAFALTRWHQLPRFRVLTLSAALALSEQGLRAIALLNDARTNPEAWAGSSADGVAFALAMSFITFLPIILIFAWAGFELGLISKAKADRKKATV